MRNILSRIVFIFVISIIFENDLIKTLINELRLNDNVKIIKKSINRENLFFNIQIMHIAFVFNCEDFRFLIIDVNKSLKKIIIYENIIQNLLNLKLTLINFYTKIKNNKNQIEKKIKCYNEFMFSKKKTNIYEDFSKIDFTIKILCFIDVMNLSMNIIDVNIVIQ